MEPKDVKKKIRWSLHSQVLKVGNMAATFGHIESIEFGCIAFGLVFHLFFGVFVS